MERTTRAATHSKKRSQARRKAKLRFTPSVPKKRWMRIPAQSLEPGHCKLWRNSRALFRFLQAGEVPAQWTVPLHSDHGPKGWAPVEGVCAHWVLRIDTGAG